MKGTIDKAIETGAEEVAAWKERYEQAKQGEGSLPPWLDMLIYGVASLGGVGGVWQTFKRNSAESALGKVIATNANTLDSNTLKGVKAVNDVAMSPREKKAVKVAGLRV